MTIQEGLTYILVNAKSETVLDLSGTDGHSKGTSTYCDPYRYLIPSPPQWTMGRQGNQWTLRNVGTGKFLGLGGPPKDNTPVRGVDDEFGWDINHDDHNPEAYRLFVPGRKLNVDLSDYGNVNNGTPVTIWGNSGKPHQTWKFVQGKCISLCRLSASARYVRGKIGL
ncbi:ricin B lectin domain-containing protein [Lyophyllum atratum]|nr:ricin B lectin domain-containing protein [Lyophyllum atratum]